MGSQNILQNQFASVSRAFKISQREPPQQKELWRCPPPLPTKKIVLEVPTSKKEGSKVQLSGGSNRKQEQGCPFFGSFQKQTAKPPSKKRKVQFWRFQPRKDQGCPFFGPCNKPHGPLQKPAPPSPTRRRWLGPDPQTPGTAFSPNGPAEVQRKKSALGGSLKVGIPLWVCPFEELVWFCLLISL